MGEGTPRGLHERCHFQKSSTPAWWPGGPVCIGLLTFARSEVGLTSRDSALKTPSPRCADHGPGVAASPGARAADPIGCGLGAGRSALAGDRAPGRAAGRRARHGGRTSAARAPGSGHRQAGVTGVAMAPGSSRWPGPSCGSPRICCPRSCSGAPTGSCGARRPRSARVQLASENDKTASGRACPGCSTAPPGRAGGAFNVLYHKHFLVMPGALPRPDLPGSTAGAGRGAGAPRLGVIRHRGHYGGWGQLGQRRLLLTLYARRFCCFRLCLPLKHAYTRVARCGAC
jgi:hypothetical protein